MSGMTGSLRYMAPEVAKREPYTEKVDVYSFGIVLWQVFTAKTPFEGLTRDMFMNNVIGVGLRPDISELDAAIVTMPTEFLTNICEELKGMITKCWDANYANRPDIKDLTESLSKMYYDFAHGAGNPQSCCSLM